MYRPKKIVSASLDKFSSRYVIFNASCGAWKLENLINFVFEMLAHKLLDSNLFIIFWTTLFLIVPK